MTYQRKRTQRMLADALLDRMEQLERRLSRKYRSYVDNFISDDDHPHYVQYHQWADGERWAIELELHKQSFYALPINDGGM